jgi:copper chaperone CopZ
VPPKTSVSTDVDWRGEDQGDRLGTTPARLQAGRGAMDDHAQSGDGPTTTTLLQIEGMHCDSCTALVEETLVEDLGVVTAEADLGSGRATVTYDPSKHSVDDLCAAILAVGYEARPAEPARPAPSSSEATEQR